MYSLETVPQLVSEAHVSRLRAIVQLGVLISLIGNVLLGAAQSTSGQVCSVNESQKLFASDASARDDFGSAVALSDTHAVLGATEVGDSTAIRSGAVYVQRRDDNGTPMDPTDDFWVEQAKLVAPERIGQRGFGTRVAISGNHIVVTSRRDSEAPVSSGVGYVFRREDNDTPSDPSDDSWVEEAKLVASDASASDFFGWLSVAIHGRWVVIGAVGAGNSGGNQQDGEGAAYVFVRDDNGTPVDPADDFWIETDKLTASNGQRSDKFGTAAAISADWAIVGAPREFSFGTGVAYIYRRDSNGTPLDYTDDTWREHAKLTSPEVHPPISAGFGSSVAIHFDGIVVGTPGEASGRGAAYVYRRIDNGTPLDLSDDDWILVESLAAPPFQDEVALFGQSVSIHGNLVVVTADLYLPFLHCDPYPCGTGKSFFFRRDGLEWALVAEVLSGHDPSTVTDGYGSSVSAACHMALVGARADHDMGFLAGAAYSYSVECGACVEDCNTNGISDDYESDLDNDGTIDECDGCPTDPAKLVSGVCGCGLPETGDSDLDGVPDCVDACPTDPEKTTPGICGCGADDALDSDGDGLPNCLDGCPTDSQKTTPGICGCGVNDDLDSDGDTIPDCVDQCPTLDDRQFAPICRVPLPTVSTWGAVTLAACLLAAVAGRAFRRRRS